MTAAAIAVLFTPLPASGAPALGAPALGAPVVAAPAAPAAPAVPDAGSRPIPLGSLVMPGQSNPATTTPATTTNVSLGLPTSPLLAKIEKRRAEVALLGDQLIELGQNRDIAREQATVAQRKQADAQASMALAEQDAHQAAADALKDAAALPPGSIGSGLRDLDVLSRIQRGESAGEQAAARHLTLVQSIYQSAGAEFTTSSARAQELSTQYDQLAEEHRKKDAALQKLERKNAGQIAAAEAAEQARDLQIGAGYTGGVPDGKSAHPKALTALAYALAQRGDPYLWSAEGPDRFDCSGLMWAAYRYAGYNDLPRVSRDQYWATHLQSVDRYSLLPGDLLFFASSTSWTTIHHVAMYAGNGMMVESPRTGLTVRLVPVRWTRLFAATRVFGPVDGPPQTPAPVPNTNPTSTRTTPGPSTSPSRSTSPSNSTAPSQSTSPSTGTSPSRSTLPNPSPSKSTPTTTPPPSSAAPPPPSSKPPTNPGTSTSSTSGGSSSGGSSSGGSSSGGSSSGGSSATSSTPSGSKSSTSSAKASKSASASKPASAGSASPAGSGG